MKHDRLRILRAQEAARLEQQKWDAFYVALNGRSTRFRDDGAYSAAVVSFENVISPVTVGVDMGAAGGDRTVVGPVAKRGFQVGDRVVEEDMCVGLKGGDLHTITAVSPNGLYVSISHGNDPCWLPHRFELVEAAAGKPVKP